MIDFSPSSITSVTLSLSGIFSLIDFVILFFFYYRLKKSSVTNNQFSYYFQRFALYFGIFPLVLAIPILLFSKSSYMLGLGYIIGHIFLYISCGYLTRIWLLIVKPSFNSRNIFIIYLVLGLVATILNIYLFNYPVINENGITLWNAQQPVAISIILIFASALIPAVVVFIRESIRQPKSRMRFSLIAASLIVILIGGPLHDVAKDVTMYLVADIVSITGYVLMFMGVVYGTKSILADEKSGK